LELHALIETLEESERYTYVFDGNSQVLDHILFSDNLFTHFQFEYDVVHVNSEFPDQASDHEPQVVRLDLRRSASPKPQRWRIRGRADWGCRAWGPSVPGSHGRSMSA